MTNNTYILSPKDASQYCGFSLSTLSRLRQIQDFPNAIEISIGRIGFMKDEVDAWLCNRNRRGGEENPLPRQKIKAPQTLEDLEKARRYKVRQLFQD